MIHNILILPLVEESVFLHVELASSYAAAWYYAATFLLEEELVLASTG